MSSTSPPPHVLVPCALSTFGLGEFRLKLRIVLVQLSIIRQSLHVTHPLAPLCSHVLKIAGDEECGLRVKSVVTEKDELGPVIQRICLLGPVSLVLNHDAPCAQPREIS